MQSRGWSARDYSSRPGLTSPKLGQVLAGNAPSRYHRELRASQPESQPERNNFMLRISASRLAVLITALALTACSSAPKQQSVQTAKVDQTGALKVHPGLLGQPVPPELQEKEEPRRVARVVAGDDTPPPVTPTGPIDASSPKQEREVYFDFNEAVVKVGYERLLEAHARYLADNPKARARIEGHADERGPDGLNKRLGSQRANAVKQALVGLGADARRISTVSFGKSRPKVPGSDEASWAANRRAEIIYGQAE